jgi:hypothetical protein
MVQQGRVDNAPFGNRWIYQFDDGKVAFVERAVRRFHAQFEERESEELLNAKELFRTLVKAHEDVAQTGMPHWLVDCLAQAHRRLERLERALYYSVFEECFSYLGRSGKIGDANSDIFGEQLWQSLNASMQQLRRESEFLIHALSQVRTIASATGGVSLNAIGGLNPEDNSTTISLILGDGTAITYNAECDFQGWDRYDHSCRITVQDRNERRLLGEAPVSAKYCSESATVSYAGVS